MEQKLADCVGAIYQAASGAEAWQPVASQLCEIMDAQSARLNVIGEGRGLPDLFSTIDESNAVYASYYHRLDPYAARARADYADNRNFHVGRALTGDALVPDEAFVSSEYYNDFASRYERRYMIGGMLGVRQATPLAVYRGDGHRPFQSREVELLGILLPHLQRALELRERLAQGRQTNWASRIALEALPVGVMIVDAGLRMHFVNATGQAQIASSRSALRSIRSGPYVDGDLYVSAASRRDNANLRRLVESAAGGAPGGSMRIADDHMLPWAILVSPAPARLAAQEADSGVAQGLVLIVFHPLRQKAPPAAAMLYDIFGLTSAEAQVAVALYGGASAEEVARQRSVSLVTVRSQIRSILGKSECENLRDLERNLATLAAIGPREDLAG